MPAIHHAISEKLPVPLNRIIQFAANFFFPNLCVYCGDLLEPLEVLFCDNCWQSLSSPHPNECPFCWVRNQAPQCTCAEYRQSGLDGIFSGWFYQGPLRAMVHQIKYQDKQRFGVLAGQRLGRQLGKGSVGSIGIVIPMPVHHTRKRERGYNQAETIAKGLCKQWDIPLDRKSLFRAKSNISQTQYNREVRQQNIKGNFAVPKSSQQKIHGKCIALVDDVMTTGATLSECAHTLKQAGTAKVFGITLARVLPESNDERI